MFQCSGWSINEVKIIVVLFLYAKKMEEQQINWQMGNTNERQYYGPMINPSSASCIVKRNRTESPAHNVFEYSNG